jgi:hypothetical protein
MTGTFKPFITGRHVEEAVTNLCVKWGAEFVAEAERQFGIEPRSVPVLERGQFTSVSDDFEKMPEDQLPVCLVLAPGLAGTPRREADRTLTAPVAVSLGFLVGVGGHGIDASRETSQVYAAAYSELLLRMPLEGIQVDDAPMYVDERYGDVPGKAGRTLGGSRIIFIIWVRNWRSLTGGPPSRTDPRPDPYVEPPPLGVVETVFRVINGEEREITPNG